MIPNGCSANVIRQRIGLLRHYAQRLTDEDMAGQLGVSADYLNRRFRQETG